MPEFTATLRHDRGRVKIITWASCEAIARQNIMADELCPESAILRIATKGGRYEITGTITDSFTLTEITAALVSAGAKRINARNAFGWSNQPKVATFWAESEFAAKSIVDSADSFLAKTASLPCIIAYHYAGESGI